MFAALLWILLLESMLFGAVRVDYVIDVRHPERRSLQVSAQIEGLPEDQASILLPTARRGATLESSRLSNVTLIKEDDEVVPADLDGARVNLVRELNSRVVLSYELASSSRLQVDKSTFIDPQRAIIQPQDILLQFEAQPVRSRFMFKLPPNWRVVNGAKRDESGGLSEPKPSIPLYLGEAETEQQVVKGCEICWVIEPVSLSLETISNLKKGILNQVDYYQTVSNKAKRAPLLIAMLSSQQTNGQLPSREDASVVASPYLIAAEVFQNSTSIDDEKHLAQYLSLGLIRSYFHVLRNLSENLNPPQLVEYLSLKGKLKMGGLTVNEFLELMARCLDRPSESAAEESDHQEFNDSVRDGPIQNMGDYFLLDLALAFYGVSSESLEEFLISNFREYGRAPIGKGEFRRKVAQGIRSNKLSTRFQGESPNDDPLKPFGLLLERRMSVQLPFELTETFQIARVQNVTNSPLMVGDRVLAINHHKLLSPEDLAKCRVQLGSMDEAEFSIQRNGSPLRFRHQIGRQTLLRLEVNQLADADKKEKLERFFSRYSQSE